MRSDRGKTFVARRSRCGSQTGSPLVDARDPSVQTRVKAGNVVNVAGPHHLDDRPVREAESSLPVLAHESPGSPEVRRGYGGQIEPPVFRLVGKHESAQPENRVQPSRASPSEGGRLVEDVVGGVREPVPAPPDLVHQGECPGMTGVPLVGVGDQDACVQEDGQGDSP